MKRGRLANHSNRFSRYTLFMHIEKMKIAMKVADPSKAAVVVPVLEQIQRDIDKWGGRGVRLLSEQACSLAIKDRSRLDDGLLNFGFRRLPIADPA